jgi:hypothetical protein
MLSERQQELLRQLRALGASEMIEEAAGVSLPDRPADAPILGPAKYRPEFTRQWSLRVLDSEGGELLDQVDIDLRARTLNAGTPMGHYHVRIAFAGDHLVLSGDRTTILRTSLKNSDLLRLELDEGLKQVLRAPLYRRNPGYIR